jgi:hypothetical protein
MAPPILNLTITLEGLIARKGKATPLQDWTGPEVFRRSRIPDFKTIGI